MRQVLLLSRRRCLMSELGKVVSAIATVVVLIVKLLDKEEH